MALPPLPDSLPATPAGAGEVVGVPSFLSLKRGDRVRYKLGSPLIRRSAAGIAVLAVVAAAAAGFTQVHPTSTAGRVPTTAAITAPPSGVTVSTPPASVTNTTGTPATTPGVPSASVTASVAGGIGSRTVGTEVRAVYTGSSFLPSRTYRITTVLRDASLTSCGMNTVTTKSSPSGALTATIPAIPVCGASLNTFYARVRDPSGKLIAVVAPSTPSATFGVLPKPVDTPTPPPVATTTTSTQPPPVTTTQPPPVTTTQPPPVTITTQPPPVTTPPPPHYPTQTGHLTCTGSGSITATTTGPGTGTVTVSVAGRSSSGSGTASVTVTLPRGDYTYTYNGATVNVSFSAGQCS
jgi:hypothetical protein